MEEKYLVINSGSSSVKFALYEMPGEELIAKGNVERIGKSDCSWLIKSKMGKIKNARPLNDHMEAVNVIMEELISHHIINSINEISGVGHRVLHGASLYDNSVLIDDKVIDDIKSLTPLGPLHHPGELAGIMCMMKLLPNVPQVAVFDTAFHQTMPKQNFMYAIPYEYYKKYGVRRYGFHGTSHKYITQYMQKLLNRDNVNLIICHIGSGASISAIKDGKCYDTSMGFTPLDGLMMGTRSGDIDPSIVDYLHKITGKHTADIIRELNEKSGLLGIAGKNDWRDIEKLADEGDEKAKLARQMFVDSVVKYIAQYYFELKGHVDGLVFTAGIGENAINFRKLVVRAIEEPMGIDFNEKVNNEIAGFKDIDRGVITNSDSKVPIYVIPTDEEKMIMIDTYNIAKEKQNIKKL